MVDIDHLGMSDQGRRTARLPLERLSEKQPGDVAPFEDQRIYLIVAAQVQPSSSARSRSANAWNFKMSSAKVSAYSPFGIIPMPALSRAFAIASACILGPAATRMLGV